MRDAGLRLRVLVDNRADSGLCEEHGLSFWLETGEGTVLFDTGQGRALAVNAPMLGVAPAQADHLVLSHGHYDHTGGVAWVLGGNPGVHVWAHPGAVRRRYSVARGRSRAIHMSPADREALETLPADRMHWVSAPVRLPCGLALTGPVPRETAFEDTGGPFFLDPEGTKPDPLVDDMALWMDTPEGCVVVVGCSHSGVVNTLRRVSELSGARRIRAVLGGFHLVTADESRLAATVDALRSMEVDILYPCHCTGEASFRRLRADLPGRVQPLRAGLSLRF